MSAFFAKSNNNYVFGMKFSIITDRCGVDNEIKEVFLELFIDVLRNIGIDYYEDFDHTDNGALIDSMRDLSIHVDHFPDVNGFTVYKEDDVLLELVELSRKLIFDDGYCFSVELEVWTFLEDQIELGE